MSSHETASAPKRAHKSVRAAEPLCIMLPPDAPLLLRAMITLQDVVPRFLPGKSVGMLALVSKAMRNVLQKVRPPASVQTTEKAEGKCIAHGLERLGKLCSITALHCKPGSKSWCMPASLCNALVKCWKLSSLSLPGTNMRNPAPKHLATVVEACSMLEYLDISHTFLGNTCMLQLAKGLQKCKKLHSLELTQCRLGGEGGRWMAGMFPYSLTSLTLSNNNLNCADAEVLGKEVRKLPLCALHLKGNKIQAPGAARLATALAHCRGLNTLDLSHNELGSQGAESLAGALRGCARLTHLNLGHIHAGEGGLRALGGLLEHCGALLHLGLRGNAQQLDGGDLQGHWVRASGQSAHLTHLDLAVSKWALVMFRQVVCLHAPTLVHLDLERASMGFLSALALAEALKTCGMLKHLNLGYNSQLDDNGMRALASGLPHCTSLQELNLSRCNVQQGGCGALAKGLPGCTALTELNLANNNVGLLGADALAEALPRCTALTKLNLSCNDIGVRGGTALADMLGRCPALVYLHVKYCHVQYSGRERLVSAAGACPNLLLDF